MVWSLMETLLKAPPKRRKLSVEAKNIYPQVELFPNTAIIRDSRYSMQLKNRLPWSVLIAVEECI